MWLFSREWTVRNVWRENYDSGGVTSRNVYPVGCGRDFIHTKLSSEPLFVWYNCKIDKLVEMGKDAK